MRNLFIGLLVVAALVVGGGFIAQTAYQAGLSTAITTTAANAPDGTVVTPVVPGYPYGYGYGPGWGWGHGGFSILGFLGTLFLIFLIIGLLRAAFWRGPRNGSRWGGPGGWGGPGKWGDHDHRGRFQETFDDWHRQAHGESTGTSPTSPKEPSA